MKIKIIVNPQSGKRPAGKKNIQYQLEHIIGKLMLEGIAEQVSITRTEYRGHAKEAAAAIKVGEFDLIIGCGGDGTINEIINGLMQSHSNIPLAILAAGTSNDFASSMHLPRTADAFCKMVAEAYYQDVDIGCANGRYFINVASFGMFTKVAHSTDQNQKNALGMLAYYLKVLRDAPSELATSFQLEFTSEEASGSGEYHLCIVSNSMSVGSIRYLMNQADVTDGVFDVLMLKKKRLLSVLPSEKNSANLTLDIESLKQTFPYAAEALSEWKPQGENDPMLIYFQTKHIEFRSEEGDTIVTDLDGEDFGTLPLTIDVAHHAIKLLVPKPSGNTDWLSNGISLIWPPRTATNNTKKERSSGQ